MADRSLAFSRPLIVILLAAVLLLVVGPPTAGAQGCVISVSATPPTVNYPGQLPQAGDPHNFGEVLDINYSLSLAGTQLQVQYQNGTGWTTLQTATAYPEGLTETTVPITSDWAHTGVNSLRVSGASCASGYAQFSIGSDPSAVSRDLATYAVVVLAGVGFYVLGRRTPLRVFVPVAAAVYLLVAPFTGQRYDVYFLLSSGIRVLQHVNPFNPGNPPVYPGDLKWAYPPLYAIYSAASYLVYQGATGAAVPSVSSLTWPGFVSSTYGVWLAFVPKSLPVLVLLLKLPMIASALATGYLLLKMTGKRTAAVFWIANPLVILVAAVWGQLDPIATLLAVLALYYYARGKQYHAYFFASVGAAVKIWPVLLIPLFLVNSLRGEGRRAVKPLSAVLPALAATVGLYAAFGNVAQTLLVLLYSRSVPTFAGRLSVNGLTWQQALTALGSPTIPIFLVVGIPLYGLELFWIYWKKDSDMGKWIVISILIFYLTYNYVNPQYFLWILPFLVIQGRRLASWVFTALPMAYVVLTYNIFYFVSPTLLLDEFSNGASIVEQLKLAYFFNAPAAFVALAVIIPTVLYFVLLKQELGRPRKNAGEADPSGQPRAPG